MSFNSLSFLVFFPIVCALVALTNVNAVKALLGGRLRDVRQWILLAVSYVFYGWWDARFCLLMLFLSCTAYVCSIQYEQSRKKFWVYTGVIVPLIVLGIFKYFNFFINSFCDLFGMVRMGTLNIILPVGISFYTFQSLSYTIDVYRGKIAAERDFKKLALYIAFFPQLVAGPIVKAGEFMPQLHEDRNINLRGIEAGAQIFVFGLFKKMVMADNIAAFVDAVYMNPAQFSGGTILLAVVGYMVQIYCDFSGYSDMAVGCARCLGYELSRNFNIPYISQNVSEFWKRWHISLSTWLQEYVYIPLGGNRKGRRRTYINLFLTMVIGGLWHGAAWTYVAWGAMYGFALCLFKIWRRWRGAPRGSLLGTAICIPATFAYTTLSQIFFRSDSFTKALQIITGIFTWQPGMVHISSWTVLSIGITVIACAAAMIRSKKLGLKAAEGYYPTVSLNTVWGLALFFTAIGLTLGLAYTGESPFIYFQF